MNSFRKMAFAALGGLAMLAIPATASAVSMIDLVGTRVQGQNVTPNYVFGTVTCPLGCQGILSDGSLSGAIAFAQDIGNASPANEAAALNALLGTSFTATDDDKENNGNTPFAFNREYISLKVGQVTAFLFNSAGLPQTLTYAGNPAGGLSHKTSFGDPVSAIPLPAAAWMLLAGLGGIAAVARRRAA